MGTGFVSDAATSTEYRDNAMGGDQISTGGPTYVTYTTTGGLDSATKGYSLRYRNFDTNADVEQPTAMLITTYHEPRG
jgi:hypothetical protein